MKYIVAVIAVLLLLSGCGITGKIVEEVENQPTQSEKDQAALEKAIENKDVSICHKLQDQPTRESCFIALAKETGDKSICYNLMGSLRESCKERI